MNELGSQGSNNLDEPGPYRPDSRADVDPKPHVARPRKYADGKKQRMKNGQGILQYVVYIVSARYDNTRHSWMYTLKDWQNMPIAGEKEEIQLG